jgi:sigma-E factor negative regulatory protein RseC
MATEQGIVIRLGADSAWVKTTRTSACEACAAKSSCITLGGGKDMEVEAINEAGAKVGDTVKIGFKSSSLLKLSFLIYIFPIICMIAGAVIGQKFALSLSYDESALSAVFGLLFFGIAFLFIRAKGNRLAEKQEYRPKITRILKHA